MDWNEILETDDFVVDKSPDESFLEPFLYLTQLPSANHNVRRRFLLAFNTAYFDIAADDLLSTIEHVVGILHNLSLLIDDVEDSSLFRRGMPTAHTRFGEPLTINCANLMYFVAMQLALSRIPEVYARSNPADAARLSARTLQIVIQEMLNLHRGQGLDIYWRDFLDPHALPLIKQYLEMVKDKTGGLFRLSVKLLNECCDKEVSAPYMQVTNILGIMYQVRDDYLNLIDADYAHMKGVAGEDLIEGKLSFPILHCLQHSDSSPVHKFMFETSRQDRLALTDMRQQCIDFMRSTGSLQFTKDFLVNCQEKVHHLVSSDPSVKKEAGSALLAIVDGLCDV